MTTNDKSDVDIGDGRFISIHTNVAEIAVEWDSLGDGSPYTKSDYLKLIEEAGPIGYAYYYALIKQEGRLIGGLYCQKKRIDLGKDYRLHTHSDKLSEKLKVSSAKFIFSFIKHEMLICGNVLLTGEYGFSLDKSVMDDSNMIVHRVLEEVANYIQDKEGVRVNSIFLKDYYTDGPFQKTSFSHSEYMSFEVQPDMVIHFDEGWSSYEDYLSAVKSKYRVKFKKIKKKGKDLEFRPLSIEEARQYNDVMYAMYKDTADRATFSLFLLGDKYFSRLKETFGDQLQLTGVFIEDKMVAFFTFLKNGSLGDAHFLGYDVKLNSKYQIYFNILLVLIDQAIKAKVPYLNLSRTAIEIKSSVGAQPHNMLVHLKYRRPFVNKRFRPYFKKFLPENNWVVRKPFKEENTNS